MKRISNFARPRLQTLLVLGLVFAMPALARAQRPGIINTASANPPLTTEQLIDPAVLAKDRTATLMVLHINDVHDHIKSPETGLGGIPYISGYVHKMRDERKDVLMLDAGDWFEKGDRMGVVSRGEATALAFGGIGIDLTVPGNHDFAYGVEQYRKDIKLSGINMVCAGIEYTDTHEQLFQPYKEFKIGDLRVAVIGGTVNKNMPADNGRAIRKFDNQELAQDIHKIAMELRPRVDLLMVLIHNGTKAATVISQIAPEIQIFVVGHTDEVTEKPMVTPSGALIVEVGRAGQWVGKLDAVVDLDQKKLGKYSYQLIPMDHSKIPRDEKLAAKIEALDQEWSSKTNLVLLPRE